MANLRTSAGPDGRHVRPLLYGCVAILIAVLSPIHSLAVTWDGGGGNSSWFDGLNWDGDSVPGPGDSVVIGLGNSVLVSNDTAALASLTLAGTLTLTNWTTTLTADQITVQSNGVITHWTCYTNVLPDNTNRVHIVCTNLTIDAGGKIDVNGKGHPGTFGGAQVNTQYYGQGAGRGFGSGGGGYGGRGGIGGYGATTNNSGFTYGSSNAPAHVGSGGGGHNTSYGTAGGGAVRIEASGTVTINGGLTANGLAFSGQAGAGSGGSIWIDCASLQGSTPATISARGGNDGNGFYSGHAGGGGRIAIYYSTVDSFTGTRSVSHGTIGVASAPTVPAQTGTLVTVYTGPDVLFTVTGAPGEYGTPTPYSYWYRPLPPGTVVTNEVNQAVPVDASLRRWCIGWIATTNAVVIDSGTTTQAVFSLPTEDTLQTWLWTNQYSLAVSAGVGGTASEAASGWYTNAVTVEVSATATGTYAFSQWSGDIPFEDRASNPATVTMDQARTLQATFVDTVTQSRTWRGTGMWWVSTNWTPVGVPNAASPVTIASGAVTYDVPFEAAHLTISNGATMRMSRWTSTMTVNGDVDVYGTLTHLLCNTNATTGTPSNSNRVTLLCTNLTVHVGGAISANAVGWRGAIALGNNFHQWGQGPGAGYQSGGGSHGGSGSYHTYGGALRPIYDSVTEPSEPGSGGGAHNTSDGGHGGGAVRVEALGTVTVKGSITADGANRNGAGGGGSGGSIAIHCRAFASSNGLISANGGFYGTALYEGGAGGGGRIAIHYDAAAQAATNLIALPVLRLSARSGWGSTQRGTPGTIYLTDSTFFPGEATMLYGGQFVIGDLASWSTASLTCGTDVVAFPDGCQVSVTGNLELKGDGGLQVCGSLSVGGSASFTGNTYSISRLYATNGSGVSVAGDLTLRNGPVYLYSSDADRMGVSVGGHCLITNGSTVYLTSGIAPGYPDQPGATLAIVGDLTIATGSTLSVYSHTTNGGSPHISAANLTVAPGGKVDANARGFAGGAPSGTAWGYGPGKSYSSCGGSYGGLGGTGNAGGTVGPTYGNEEAPMEPGSGGGSYNSTASGRGGGLVRILLAGTARIDGSITANGQHPNSTSGAGSGGAIYITCRQFAGAATGILSADGGGNRADGSGYGGAGGGGRIAVSRSKHTFLGSTTVAGGIGYNATRNGSAGTLAWVTPAPGSVFVIH